MAETQTPAVLWDVVGDKVMVFTLQWPRANALGLPIIEGLRRRAESSQSVSGVSRVGWPLGRRGNRSGVLSARTVVP